MIEARRIFNERVPEIETYLTCCHFIDKQACNQHVQWEGSTYEGGIDQFSPTRELQQIIRANAYVIIYNLIEAVINQIAMDLLDALNDEQLNITHLTEVMRDLCLENEFLNKTTSEKISKEQKKLLLHITNNEVLHLEKLDFKISGNVDYRFICNIKKRIGLRGAHSMKKIAISEPLLRIKKYRNDLAHGNCSFTSMGSTIVMRQIDEDWRITRTFLDELITQFETYINQKNFRL